MSLINKHPVLLVFTVALLLIIPLGILTSRLSFRLDTDYDVALPMARFVIMAYTQPVPFLTRNPYIGLGVPVLGDPSSLVFSPFYVPFFLLFGADTGIRMIIAGSVMLSGYSMWLLLKSLSLGDRIAIWGAVLYETSGALAAIVADGHIEKLASYAVTPLVFLFMLKKKQTIVHLVTIGLLFTCMYLSDDFYTPWFLSIFLVSFMLFRIFRKNLTWGAEVVNLAVVYGSFIVFSLPKIIPFVRDVLPYFDRTPTVDPYMGSVHAPLLLLQYIIPWQVSFYDRPILQRILGFRYNWYEYYVFISPLAFLVLIKIRKIVRMPVVQWIFVACVIGALYVSLGYMYSPFNWLFHAVSVVRAFRVPQRIAVPLLVPLIILFSYSADTWFREAKKSRMLPVILIGSILWTFIVSFQTMKSAFVPFRQTEKFIAGELRHRDTSNFYVVNFACCMQNFLLDQKIPILNYYYGWTPTYAPTFKSPFGDRNDFSQFLKMRPSYIIAPNTDSFERFGYMIFFGRDSINVWKTDSPNIFPSL